MSYWFQGRPKSVYSKAFLSTFFYPPGILSRKVPSVYAHSHYFREIFQDDDLYYSLMAPEIPPLNVSCCQRTALYLSCPIIILSLHFHLKEMCGYYKLGHVRRHPRLQILLPLLAGRFLRTRTRRPRRPTGTEGGSLGEIKISAWVAHGCFFPIPSQAFFVRARR